MTEFKISALNAFSGLLNVLFKQFDKEALKKLYLTHNSKYKIRTGDILRKQSVNVKSTNKTTNI